MPLDQILQGDAFAELSKLPDASVQAVIADPPYFNVLEDEAWNTQWPTPEDYLTWCEAWVGQTMRVLRPDGLCFLFGQLGKSEHTFLHLMSRLTQRHPFHDLLIWDRAVGYNERRDSFTPQYEMVLVLRGAGEVKFRKDAVRVPYDARKIERYLRDKRYKNPEARRRHLRKGRYATNLLRVPSLKGASKEKCGHPPRSRRRSSRNWCSAPPIPATPCSIPFSAPAPRPPTPKNSAATGSASNAMPPMCGSPNNASPRSLPTARSARTISVFKPLFLNHHSTAPS